MNSMNDGRPNRQGVPPEVEARLRDPRHPVHRGLILYPVPNLIVTRTGVPRQGERYLKMSRWMRKTVVWAHYSRLQWFLMWAGLVVFLAAVVLGVAFIEPTECESSVPGRAVCYSE